MICQHCGHRDSYHRHNDDLLDHDCHDATGNYACEHFRCVYPWTGRNFAHRPACKCLNFIASEPESVPEDVPVPVAYNWYINGVYVGTTETLDGLMMVDPRDQEPGRG